MAGNLHIAAKNQVISHLLGNPDLVHAFFCTISVRLEPDGWGTRFPKLMKDLYERTIRPDGALELERELKTIEMELRGFSPDDSVWSLQDRAGLPAPGDTVEGVTSLAGYFRTPPPYSENFFDKLIEAARSLTEIGGALSLVVLLKNKPWLEVCPEYRV